MPSWRTGSQRACPVQSRAERSFRVGPLRNAGRVSWAACSGVSLSRVLPKRFPDREEIATVRVEAAELEPGVDGAGAHRLAGRVLARRDLGKLMFLDLVDRSGRIQLLVRPDEVGDVDIALGDIVGVEGPPTKSRRGEPSLAVRSLELLAKIRV